MLGWSENPKKLIGYIKRVAKVDNINWLTVKGAMSVVKGFKAIYQREHEKILRECRKNKVKVENYFMEVIPEC